MDEKLLTLKNKCQEWHDNAEEMEKVFEEANMIGSQYSSRGMAQAY